MHLFYLGHHPQVVHGDATVTIRAAFEPHTEACRMGNRQAAHIQTAS